MQDFKKFILACFLLFGYSACAVSATDALPGSAEYLEVVSVKENDTLSMRQSENSQSGLVYKIPYNASGLLKIDSTKGWVKISYNGYTGWASSKFLKKGAAPSVKSELSSELFCLGTEPHWTLGTDGNNLNLKKFDVSKTYIFDASIRKSLNDTGIWWLHAIDSAPSDEARNNISVLIKKDDQCSDGMSDSKYAYSIVVIDSEATVLSGCCKNK